MIEDHNGKQTANSTIVAMLAYLNGDRQDLIYTAAEKYAATLSKSGDTWPRITRLLRDKPLKLIQLQSLSPELKKLMQVVPTTADDVDDNVYVNQPTRELVDELLKEWQNRDTFRFHNIPVRSKILLHGPTGNGKTTMARHIAKQAKLPFVEIKSESVVESRLGNSGSNISRIFNDIKEPCVLFWDEVDTIGRARSGRDDSSGVAMENERMVNAVLTNMEKLDTDVIFIGATNRRAILDKAFLRRFDIEHELAEPTLEEKQAFYDKLFAYYKFPDDRYSITVFNNLDACSSYAQIKKEMLNMARKYVISKLT